MVQYLNALQSYQDEVTLIQDQYRSEMKLYEAQAEMYQAQMEDYQKARLSYESARNSAIATAEGLINIVPFDAPEEIIMESSGTPVCAEDEIRVVDLDGNELPDGEAGELLTRGPYTIRGYYDAPQTNAAAFTPDGFYRMGDVVRKDGRYLFTEGRRKDLINRGGEKISSDEIENLILKHPAVDGCCVVAMPDPVFGEKACAFVVLQPGGALTLPELCAFLLAQRIAKFKLPERLEIVERFPISPAGKILRRELRERIAATLAHEGAADRPRQG